MKFTTGKETCEKHVKIFTCISHVKTCEIYDFICFEVSFTCFNILKNMWKLKNAFEACEIYDFTCFFTCFLKFHMFFTCFLSSSDYKSMRILTKLQKRDFSVKFQKHVNFWGHMKIQKHVNFDC